MLSRSAEFLNLIHLDPEAFLHDTATFYAAGRSLQRVCLLRDDRSLTGMYEGLNRFVKSILLTRNVSVPVSAKSFDHCGNSSLIFVNEFAPH